MDPHNNLVSVSSTVEWHWTARHASRPAEYVAAANCIAASTTSGMIIVLNNTFMFDKNQSNGLTVQKKSHRNWSMIDTRQN